VNKITVLTDDPNQSMILKLEDGTMVDFNLNYYTEQRGWFYSLTYNTFSLKNRRLVVSPNMLRNYRNVLPFGIACNTSDGYEPVFVDDFKNGRASFFLLNPTDVLAVESFILDAQI
jgi:hypothetical protein